MRAALVILYSLAQQKDDSRCNPLNCCAALEEFDFSERVSLRQIKKHSPALVRRYHSDFGQESDSKKNRRINAAHLILRAYCHGYRFNCSRTEFLEQSL